MRKDVKIGLSIGGLLLAVLIVYLLVPKNNDTRQVARDTDSANTGGGRQEGTGSGFGGNSTTPLTSTGGVQDATPGASQAPEGARETPAAPDRPAAPEATQPPADAPTKPVDWERILLTGKVPPEAQIPLAAVPPGNTGNNRAETDVFGDPQKGANTGQDINWQSAGTMPPGSPGGAGPAPTPAAPRQTPKEHVVQQGEHLSSISLAVYGDARHYKEILKANPGLDERKLRPGTKIKIPDPSTFATPAKAQQAVARLEPSVDPAKEYRVAPGDSLHKIAMKLYGKAAKADDLYELNKDKIGDDSSRVKVGMVLKLPEPPTASSAQSSR
jgi:nucleoid-associated protein YgaU